MILLTMGYWHSAWSNKQNSQKIKKKKTQTHTLINVVNLIKLPFGKFQLQGHIWGSHEGSSCNGLHSK